MTEQVNGALSELARRREVEFPCLHKARTETQKQLLIKQAQLAGIAQGPGAALCLMGSWGRRELSQGSDDDWLILLQGSDDAPSQDFLEGVARILGLDDREPGAQRIFGTWTPASSLVGQIGLDRDDNSNLTRRVLLMLESLPALNEHDYDHVRTAVLDGYLDASLKDYRPPRFFLNDIVRYWRTICVDFVGKERERHGEGWGLRNAKLRNSRKVLFASGLLPLLLCCSLRAEEMRPFMTQQLEACATDRLAHAFIACGAEDAGVRALSAYDRFLGLLDDIEARKELKALRRENALESNAFKEARRLGNTLQDALLALLFETDRLRSVTRRYGIF